MLRFISFAPERPLPPGFRPANPFPLRFHLPVRIRLRPLFVSLLLALAAGPLSGCAVLAQWASKQETVSPTSSEELLLRLTLEKPVYRPGEAILAQVSVVNTTDQVIKIRGLNRESATFWFGEEGGPRRVQRFPVFSKKEDLEIKQTGAEVLELAPGEIRSRPFLLTQLSKKVGSYVAQVHMDPFERLQVADRSGKLYSNLAEFEVRGEPYLQRDNMGLIILEEAINIAAAATPGDIVMTDALMIEDEMGFYKWWINVAFRRPGGRPRASRAAPPRSDRVAIGAGRHPPTFARMASRSRGARAP